MNVLFRMIIVIVLLGVLTACGSSNDDEDQSETNNEDETPDEQMEDNDNEDAEEEPIEDNDENENNDSEEEPNESEDPDTEQEVVLENEAFQIFEPTPNAEVNDRIVVRGLARVFEGTINFEFEDGHFIMDEGFTTASQGGPEWGEFELVINIGGAEEGEARIILFEVSAKDGSRIHELIIPVTVKK